MTRFSDVFMMVDEPTMNSILDEMSTLIEDATRPGAVRMISSSLGEAFHNRGITLSFSSEEELDQFAEELYDAMTFYLQDLAAPYAKGER